MDKAFGKTIHKPLEIRIPMRSFYDFRPGGSLCHMLSNIYRYKSENNISSTIKDDVYEKMMQYVFSKLIEQKFFRLPTAYIRAEVDADLRQRIIDIFNEWKCEITENMDQATHIIYPEMNDQPIPENFARPLFKGEDNMMMHWYYLPDSYNSWLPNKFDLPVR